MSAQLPSLKTKLFLAKGSYIEEVLKNMTFANV